MFASAKTPEAMKFLVATSRALLRAERQRREPPRARGRSQCTTVYRGTQVVKAQPKNYDRIKKNYIRRESHFGVWRDARMQRECSLTWPFRDP